MRLLLTGAAGFVGSHLAEWFTTACEPWEVVALDCLTYAGRLDRLAHLDQKQIKYVYHDFSQPYTDALLKQIGKVDYIIHNGACSHVSRSFREPRTFVNSNIFGTLNTLEAARKLQPKKMIYVSTDEVFGPAVLPHKPEDKLTPTNPYAATKAAGDLLAYSYFRSFDVPVLITHTMNIFGERQHPEKFVPMTIKKILNGQTVQIHGQPGKGHNYGHHFGAWTFGTRNWLYAKSQASALMFLLDRGVPGEKYNISGTEKSNLDIFHLVSWELQRMCQWEPAQPPPPVHDLNYALDGSKLASMGWKDPFDFEPSFRRMVKWTAENPTWLED